MQVGFPFAPADSSTDFGGYPIGYLMDDGEYLCASCVNDASNPVHAGGEQDGWRLEGLEVLEGSFIDYDGPVHCSHCNTALVPMDLDELESIARTMGAEHGYNAAAWCFDGYTDHETYLAMLQGIEDADPIVLNSLPSSPLSGEFADSPTPSSVLTEIAGASWSDLLGDAADDLLRAYEDAFATASLDEIVRVARYHTTSAQTIAKEAAGYFETRTRDDGSRFVSLKDDRPEWLTNLIYSAHGDMVPDDWKYATIRDALEYIADSDDPDEDGSHEFADGRGDVYNSDRIAWLASSGYRQGYCDDAAEEFGLERDTSIMDRIGLGQYLEASQIYGSVLRSLEARLEDVIA